MRRSLFALTPAAITGGQRRGATPRTIRAGAKERATRLVVDVGNRAGAWREAATDAERAFVWWRSAPARERRDAATAYLAAIDREEKAATEYWRAWEACCSIVP